MPSEKSLLTLLTGDSYLRRRKLEILLNQLLPKEERAFNFFRVDLKEAGVQSLITQARSFPMLGERQVFLIRNPAEVKKDQIPLLEAYFQNPTRHSYFIFDAEELAETHPLLGLILQFGERVDFIQNEKRAGLDLIHRKLKSENRAITKEAWQFLEEKTGGNLALLDACVEKLMLYVAETSAIDLAAASKLADELLVFDSFDLTDAVCEKTPKRALQIFRFLYNLEGSGVLVIGLLNWQLKRIWQAKVILRERGEKEIFKTIRISPYRLPGFLKQVARFEFDELERAFAKLFEIDWKLKTGAWNEKVVLETFIIELASRKKEIGLLTV